MKQILKILQYTNDFGSSFRSKALQVTPEVDTNVVILNGTNTLYFKTYISTSKLCSKYLTFDMENNISRTFLIEMKSPLLFNVSISIMEHSEKSHMLKNRHTRIRNFFVQIIEKNIQNGYLKTGKVFFQMEPLYRKSKIMVTFIDITFTCTA